ncbi:MAG: aldehyde dehydrogenase family protein [Verrucomicrobia bacterium]|jgi:succinate-semialdehyde dehydrogenase/glutarate-semialdehyde dehydrogenase|nr:aldehyde dehydrogenase family protein [Verrucomicrobiota bacterium]
MLISVNPATGQAAHEVESLDAADLKETIDRAATAAKSWRKTSIAERAEILKAVAETLRSRKDAIGKLMTEEMGKPVKEAAPEVEKGAWCADHYAEHAAGYLQDEIIASDASKSFVSYQPLGAILCIFPWNAPIWVAMRGIVPALMAGNTVVMKHDPHVPACAVALEQAFRDTGAPADILCNLPIPTKLAEQAIRHPAIQAVSFTGSTKAGSIVAATAASEIKHSVLELGGSDPFVVLADADLERAADIAVLSRTINAGQSCIAAKRIIIEAPVYEQFVDRLKGRLAKLTVGDPSQASTDIGPIARDDLRENLHRQVTQSISEGADCLLGGELPEGPGFFYPCTLLAGVTPKMCAFNEETFGPVMVATRAEDAEDALQLANDTPYGLGAAVWTADADQGLHFANEIEAGQVSINGIVKTDPRLPSGGTKRSGIGRELGPHGIREFTNAKQIWIQ